MPARSNVCSVQDFERQTKGNDMSTATFITSHRTVRAARTRLRLTKRGRIVLTALAAIPVVVVAVLVMLGGGQATATSTPAHVHFQHVTIEPGESLWQLASEEAPSSDPRDFIQDVVSLNNLPSAAVQAGQRLAIPTKYTQH
jgi:hypothetical protein